LIHSPYSEAANLYCHLLLQSSIKPVS